jgi:hypothetical protein
VLDAADLSEQFGELRSMLKESGLQHFGSFKREARLIDSAKANE